MRVIAVLTALLALVGAAPAHADGQGDPWSPVHRVFFWENPQRADDGVELGPASASYLLRGVTRDCAIFCWHDWDDVPASAHVQAATVLTVWDNADRSGPCANIDGGAVGRTVDDLAALTGPEAGLPFGQHWAKRISSVQLTRHGGVVPDCVWVRRGPNLVADAGFEQQREFAVRPPWGSEGPDLKAIDLDRGFAKSGADNAFIRTSSRAWNAVTQFVPVTPHTTYRLHAWVRTSGNYTAGFFGVRPHNGTPFVETGFGAGTGYRLLTVTFDSGTAGGVTVFSGYWAPGVDSWMQVDDVTLAVL
ncbi:hypothetical protein LZG04_30450 [Saccharothrix sp. S26]|uniref:hypothetical protein n=1 Tax=Saccharothrix sp. S26 TaxID=2907215 RepID=UPI001F18A810|nr:hypothetical protein [Saccharothrix sp. S26]MCE6999093.1 hypothetical protein [Saccharothrix sp. S26]